MSISSEINRIDINWWELFDTIRGLRTEVQNRIVIEREVIPIIFIPGIMGSRLKIAKGESKGERVWDPDSSGFMFTNYGRFDVSAKNKKALLIGERFDPEYLEVDTANPKLDESFLRRYPGADKRGWGGVMWGSYGPILRALHDHRWEEPVGHCFEFPVHAFGYNWTASNLDAGGKLKEYIDVTIDHYAKGLKDEAGRPLKRICTRVILVTHSMGGLVARSACVLHDAAEKVLGVVHGVQPASGSPAAYWRMKAGFERPTGGPRKSIWDWFLNPVKMFERWAVGHVSAWILGTDGAGGLRPCIHRFRARTEETPPRGTYDMTTSITLRRAALFLLITPLLALLACTSSEGTQKKGAQPATDKGAPRMITYPIGRFAIDLPAEMKLAHQGQRLRYAEIEEFDWPSKVPHEQARDEAWKKRLTEIGKLTPPKGKERVIIESRDFPGLGAWARGVFYYGNYMMVKEGKWAVLLDYGNIGVWIETRNAIIETENINKMLRNINNIVKSYTTRRFGELKSSSGSWFYTEHGTLNLPYLRQESAAARFEGHPLGLEINIETTETHKEEPENHGLIGRTTAAIITGYAAGIDIKRIRSRTRVVAGLKGDEEVDRMDDGTRSVLSFAWRFAGRKDSGEQPKILITMESADGHLEEKLQIWDAVLNSLKPMYGTGK